LWMLGTMSNKRINPCCVETNFSTKKHSFSSAKRENMGKG